MNLTKEKLHDKLVKIQNLGSTNFWHYLQNDTVFLFFSDFTNNWGDAVNPFLIKKLTGKNVVSSKRMFNFKNRDKIFGIGSILNAANADLRQGVIWGSGFLQEPKKDFSLPRQILALRGKKTAKIFTEKGVLDPGIYGDPALLFPTIYNPETLKKYKLGIIPHYTEINEFQNDARIQENKDITVISPIVKKGDYLEIIDRLKECENIMSSSLHGLILADAYGIPSLRFRFGSKIIGGDFKYDDYYSGVGVESFKTIDLKDIRDLDTKDVLKDMEYKDIQFDGDRFKAVLIDYLNA